MSAIKTTDHFDLWYTGLRDRQTRHRIEARLRRAELGNLGDCRPVGEGVSEMRIHFGPGYRIYFIQMGQELIILLAAGDKQSQTKDIQDAIALARLL